MYCGIDIIEVNRIKEAILKNEKFKYKIFSKNEIDSIEVVNSSIKYQRYAGRFSAKEAIFKSISNILNPKNIIFEFNKIEILNDNNGKPYINYLDENIKDIMKEYNTDVSISHIKETATSIAIVTKK